jgi:hypothetical protein
VSLSSVRHGIKHEAAPAVDVFVRDFSVHVKSELDIWSYVPNTFPRREGQSPRYRSKVILDEVSANMPAGSLTEMLGSSENGKTESLNAITHRVPWKSMDVSSKYYFQPRWETKKCAQGVHDVGYIVDMVAGIGIQFFF